MGLLNDGGPGREQGRLTPVGQESRRAAAYSYPPMANILTHAGHCPAAFTCAGHSSSPHPSGEYNYYPRFQRD